MEIIFKQECIAFYPEDGDSHNHKCDHYENGWCGLFKITCDDTFVETAEFIEP